jgi:hypothetical protein
MYCDTDTPPRDLLKTGSLLDSQHSDVDHGCRGGVCVAGYVRGWSVTRTLRASSNTTTTSRYYPAKHFSIYEPLQKKATMTIRATKFTPEVLLEAPRRSEGLPNSDASQVLYSISSYSFAQHEKKSEIRILDVESQQSSLITDEKSASEPAWIDDETIVVLYSEDDGTTSVVVGSPKNFEKR